MTHDRPIMFYDGGCPLCRREVAHYRRLDRQARIQWTDINQHPEQLSRHGITPQAAMTYLHVRGSGGQIYQGAEAFLTLWQELPYYRHLGRFVTLLRLQRPLDWGYRRFARWRLQRRCTDGVCTTDNKKGR
ncbi:DUF393 domain-containing protein [Thiohalophilus sp.]|uniref:thiol-disulfide oxidoreductase DCC family protein n=1 Tax=Thiohalophilus sp. TaxID=3028392 RepID=UPI002ACD25C9|nr:DUF393 domain-containing protein [Thiohalophilus sp.]MDZ7804519.1 DUF393 domain-containing protein [Thiohalophilus sp.]